MDGEDGGNGDSAVRVRSVSRCDGRLLTRRPVTAVRLYDGRWALRVPKPLAGDGPHDLLLDDRPVTGVVVRSGGAWAEATGRLGRAAPWWRRLLPGRREGAVLLLAQPVVEGQANSD